jgi:hypothetical protein
MCGSQQKTRHEKGFYSTIRNQRYRHAIVNRKKDKIGTFTWKEEDKIISYME